MEGISVVARACQRQKACVWLYAKEWPISLMRRARACVGSMAEMRRVAAR